MTESITHFAPWGSTNAQCDETVPRGVAWDAASSEYNDERFTVRIARTTCPECLRQIRIHNLDRGTCPAKDHRRWTCHYAKGHDGEHAFDDIQEMAQLRERVAVLERDNQYFRDSPNLAFYQQGLEDRKKLERIKGHMAVIRGAERDMLGNRPEMDALEEIAQALRLIE